MNVNYKKMLVKKSKKNIYTGGTPGVNNNEWTVVKSKKESKKESKKKRNNGLVFRQTMTRLNTGLVSRKPMTRLNTTNTIPILVTPQHLVFSHNLDVGERKQYYYVSPIELNVSLLQFLVDNNLLVFTNENISSQQSNNEVSNCMGINGFPSLTIEKHTQSKFSKKDSKIIDVYQTEFDERIYNRAYHLKNMKERKEFRAPGFIRETNQPVILTNDIFYVTQLVDKLSHYKRGTCNRECNQQCDLNFSSRFDIVYEKTYPNIGTVVIVGYPDPNDMNHFLKNTRFMDYYFKDYKTYLEYERLLIEFYNSLRNAEKDKIKKITELLLNLEITKDFMVTLEGLIRHLDSDNTDTIIEELKKEIMKKLDEKFKSDLFNRPNIRISYVFHHFVETATGEYEPMIFSVSELESKHKPVLDDTLELIEKEIPKRFDILRGSETSFSNFYSYYRYGDVFYIRTEYLPLLSNLDLYPHIYDRAIILDELIYNCSFPDEMRFWKRKRLDYKLKNNRIEFEDGHIQSTRVSLKVINNVSKFKSKQYNPKRNFKSVKKIKNSNSDNLLYQAKVFKLELDPNKKVKIYYMKDGEFFLLLLSPIINTASLDELYDLYNSPSSASVYECNTKLIKTIQQSKPIYKVEKHTKVSPEFVSDKLVNIFNPGKSANYYTFMILKQQIIHHTFLDGFFMKHFGKKYTDYYPILAYNIFNHYNQSDDVIDFTKVNKKCDFNICSKEEFKQATFKKIDLVIGDIRILLIIHKIKLNDGYKFVVWVYKTEKDGSSSIDGNKLRYIYNLDSYDVFKKIIDKLREDTDIFPSSTNNNLPKKNSMYINKVVGLTTEVLHIQILPEAKPYLPNQFKDYVSFSYENREENVDNILNNLQLNNNYYTYMIDRSKNNKMFVYSSLILSFL
jgi:hypothetical protein